MTALNDRIVHDQFCFSHQDACEAEKIAWEMRLASTVTIDLANTEDASTAALARLVLLRRNLLRAGRDLRLVGLHGRAGHLYHLNRLSHVLPAC